MKRACPVGDGDGDGDLVVSEDLILEILLLLPVKILIRFKCVCKRWRDVISSPDFAFAHYSSRKRRGSDGDSVEFMVTVAQERTGLLHPYRLTIKQQEEALQQVHQPPGIRHIDFYSGNGFTYDKEILLGPSLGVYCKISGNVYSLTSNRERITLWNPAAREAKVAPFIPAPSLYMVVGYGFGHCSSSSGGADFEFKMVRLLARRVRPRFFDDIGSLNNRLEVYSSRTNSWRSVETSVASPCVATREGVVGVVLNQIVHWYVLNYSDNNNVYHPCIFTFNLREETCGRMDLPPQTVTDDTTFKGMNKPYWLTTSDDRYLTLIAPSEEFMTLGWYYVDVWVMRAPSAWTKHARVVCEGMVLPVIAGYWNNFDRGVVLFGQDDRVEGQPRTFLRGENLIMFVDGIRRKIPIPETGRLRVINYIESLFTLDSSKALLPSTHGSYNKMLVNEVGSTLQLQEQERAQ